MTGVNVTNPLSLPYQTGSYLIVDNPDGKNNFRSAMSLADRPYRASGDHQFDVGMFVYDLAGVANGASRLFLVDLREESHGFIDTERDWGRAVSWYTDNDWSNVGQTPAWIDLDERTKMTQLSDRHLARVFTLIVDKNDNRQQERQLPVSYEDITVVDAYIEQRAAQIIEAELGLPVDYRRIPATDHCGPSERALFDLVQLHHNVGPDDWVHFHCHGGDGRTTTFLALWDMLQWQGPLPPLEEFAVRQCELFSYCLYPGGCENCGKPETGWKAHLAAERWQTLGRFLEERR